MVLVRELLNSIYSLNYIFNSFKLRKYHYCFVEVRMVIKHAQVRNSESLGIKHVTGAPKTQRGKLK